MISCLCSYRLNLAKNQCSTLEMFTINWIHLAAQRTHMKLPIDLFIYLFIGKLHKISISKKKEIMLSWEFIRRKIMSHSYQKKLSKTVTNHSHYVTWSNSFRTYSSQCLTVTLIFILKPSIWFTMFTNTQHHVGQKSSVVVMAALCFRDLAFSSRCTPVWYFGVLPWAWL